jgi:hypothetical protein
LNDVGLFNVSLSFLFLTGRIKALSRNVAAHTSFQPPVPVGLEVEFVSTRIKD